MLMLFVLLVSSHAAFLNFQSAFEIVGFGVVSLVWISRGRMPNFSTLVFVMVCVVWYHFNAIVTHYYNVVTLSGWLIRMSTGLLAVVAINYRQPVLELFVKWVVRLAAIDLVFYALFAASARLAEAVFDYAPSILSFDGAFMAGGNMTGGWPRTSLIIFTVAPTRHLQNHGFMWEPSAYGAVLVLALMMRIVQTRKTFDVPNAILFLSAITTFSTTTFLALFVLVAYLVMSRSKYSLLYAFVLLPIGLTVFLNTDFLLPKIQEEIDTGEDIASTRYTLSRYTSMILDSEDFVRHPLIGDGLSRPDSIINFRLPSNNGLTDAFNRYGFIMTIYMFIFTVVSFGRIRSITTSETYMLFLLALIFSWAERFFEYPFWFMIVFSGWSVQALQTSSKAKFMSLRFLANQRLPRTFGENA